MRLEHQIGEIRFQGKDLTVTRDGKVVLINHLDYSEFVGMAMILLISKITELSTAIDSLKDDMRKLRVGHETFTFGEKVEESDDVDQEDLEDNDK